MNGSDGYLLAAIGALSTVIVILFKILMTMIEKNRIQSEAMTKELTRNSIIIENNTKVFDKVMELVNKSVKR